MRFRLILSLCAFLLSGITSFSTGNPPVEPKKYALIIAIGSYESQTGWMQISSKNDIPLIKGALLKLGFTESNITTLLDAQATRTGIINGLMAIEKKVAPGDMVVLHISSHGQQISDNNDDEVDGRDEAIVGYGAPVSNTFFKSSGGKGSYDGSLHVRDDEFGDYINRIRVKVGSAGHVLAILDACHSGSGTRGFAKVRGGTEPFILDSAKPVTKTETEDGGFGLMGEKTKSRGAADVSMGKFVLISGSSAQEVNYETEDENGNGVGSLSYCLSKVLASVPAGSTYRKVFASVLSEMANRAPKQTPQIEGDIDFELFGGKFLQQKKYFSVSSIESATEVIINAGKLMNVFEGTPVVVEKAGTNEPGKTPLVKGKITKASNFESVVTFESPIEIKSKVDVWIFPTGAVLPDKRITVNVDTIANAEFKNALTQAIQQTKIAEVVKGKSDLTIADTGLRFSGSKSRGSAMASDKLQIIASAFGSPLKDATIPTSDIQKGVQYFSDVILNYSQGKMLLDFDFKDAEYSVRITRILPVKAGSKNLSDTVAIKDYLDKGNMLNIPEGNYIFLEVKNEGEKDAFFNIVDIEPSGQINPLLPTIKNNTIVPELASLNVDAGETKIIKYPIRISPPYGIEIFKVIATGVPFDLASTIKIPEYRSRGVEAKPARIETLLGESFKATNTRGGSLDQSDMGTSSYEFAFKIVK